MITKERTPLQEFTPIRSESLPIILYKNNENYGNNCNYKKGNKIQCRELNNDR